MERQKSTIRGWVVWGFALVEVLLGKAIVWTLILVK